MATLRKLVLQMQTDTALLRRDLEKNRREVRKFAKGVRSDLAPARKAFQGLTNTVKSLIPVLSGALVVAAIRGQADFADELGKVSAQLGTNVEFLSEASFAAERFNIRTEQLTLGLQRMTRRISEAASGTGEAKKAIQELGLSAHDLEAASLDEQFETILEELSQIPNEADRVRLAMRFFDSEGVKLARLAGNLDELREEARALGVTITKDMARAAAEANDAFTNLRGAMDGLIRTLLPGIAEGLANIINKVLGLKRAVNLLDFEDLVGERQELTRQLEQVANKITFVNKNINKTEQELRSLRAAAAAEGFTGLIAGIADPEGEREALIGDLEKIVERLAQVNKEIAAREELGDLSARDLIPETGVEAREAGQNAGKAFGKGFGEEFSFEAVLGQPIQDEEFFKGLAQTTATEFEQAKEPVKEFSEFSVQAARNAQSAFADFLFDPFQDGLDGMLKGFIDVIRRMLAEAAAAKIFSKSSGFFEGILSAVGLGGVIPGLQHGGSVRAGRPVIVGEAGPELFVPGANGRIVPNASAGPSFVFNNVFNVESGADVSQLAPVLEQHRRQVKAEVFDTINRGLVPA